MAFVSGAPSSSKIIVNRRRQEGNPVIKYIRNLPYEFSTDIKTDFECFPGCSILYLSLKYHKLHPAYIETRISDVSKYQIKILLLLVNVDEPSFLLRDLNILCYRIGLSLVLCHSIEEAAEYIENFRISYKKNAEAIIEANKMRASSTSTGEQVKTKAEQFREQAVNLLSSIRTITQSDAKMLLQNFGSISDVSRASADTLSMITGIGSKKAKCIQDFFRSPFTVP